MVRISIDLDFIENQSHAELINLTLRCHANAAVVNKNASSFVGEIAFEGSGSFKESVVASLMTTGVKHAPIGLARSSLALTVDQVKSIVSQGGIIYGFGNSFFREAIDPSFQPIYDFIRENYPEYQAKIDGLHQALVVSGKNVFPNAAISTAAVCEIIGCPVGLEDFFFILGRIPAWASQANLILKKQ